MKELRNPENGCPWDLKQTHQSLKKYVLEETYEVMDAIDGGNINELKTELGDLLLQIVFHAQVADEVGNFNFDDICNTISDKLVSRHPHIFSDVKVQDADEVERNWELIKKKKENKKSLLDGIPRNYSALLRSLRIQQRVAGVGFEWSETDGIIDKVKEEISELTEAIEKKNSKEIEEELGDLFFILVNLAKRYEVDPEEALQKTNDKFTKRFGFIENTLESRNETFEGKSLEYLDNIWDEAKEYFRGISVNSENK
ncbi:MAG: nucleoside triphosphate pyrophosphohydrolase [Candidatus Delongbacteria bacterium]|nr:nucleoside triphosphate pyrophosphohydrolase [Candidatus Delongbacteria bacterium]MBN2834707.1 nucleoside triphosphate pyrophosphohydrolase [Candidatus Delongbacteria bacterium]